jgi:hypothetical protein
VLVVEVIFLSHMNELSKHVSILIVKEFFVSVPVVSQFVIDELTGTGCVFMMNVFQMESGVGLCQMDIGITRCCKTSNAGSDDRSFFVATV